MHRTSKQPTAISLFSGAGGLDLGFESMGYRVVFANELDADAAATWKANRLGNDVMRQGDINSFIGNLGTYKGTDNVFGGPPCQGFSVAGKMNPDDPRNQLIRSFMDVVAEVEPKVFVIENVRALGVLEKWSSVRSRIIERANKLGYDCSFEVYSASDYGVPQNRERVVFVGARGGCSQSFFDVMPNHRAVPMPLRDVLLSSGQYGTESNPKTCKSHVSLAKNPVLRASACLCWNAC